MGSLFSGALITEQVFAYLGMGKTIYDAVIGNDYNVALVGLLLATLTTLLANLVADLAYSWLDPRISYRSEEHTSELQSLMRISYAVFCLKKKKINIKLHK